MNARQFLPFFILICLFSISINSLASNPIRPATSAQAINLMQQNKALLFEENKGQLMDENHKAITDVKYYAHSNGVYLYCKPGMISFVFTKEESDGKISGATGTPETQCNASLQMRQQRSSLSALHSSISTSRTDLVLINSNPNAQITATDQQEYYENFYTTGDADHGITNVHTYKTVTYKNIYPDIDMILKTEGQGMEYSFLVHPGGNVGEIQLRWDGVEGEENLENGDIKYSNALGSMEESAPKSFTEGKELKSRFIKEGDVYSFEIQDYDKTKDLLIDPTLTMATYFGGNNEDKALGLSTDTAGNIYVTGYTASHNGVATSGAYTTSFGGNVDAFLAKFNSSGAITWATYFGLGAEFGFGVSTDTSGHIYITGITYSYSGIATSGAYQSSMETSNGYYVGSGSFLAMFSSAGTLSWATYYGGFGTNWPNGISADDSGNVYIAGYTSSSDRIVTLGAYQVTMGGGDNDAFLAKFSSAGKLSWGTYYGGSLDEYANSVTTDGSGNVYIAGETASKNKIATSGAYQASYAGGGDGFLAKFGSSGTLSWATYYGGDSEDDAQGIITDASGSVYITGYTTSSSGIATKGAYQTSYAGGYADAFLAKFSSTGSLLWGTYYGDTGRNTATAISADGFGNIYITGWTDSNSHVLATAGAYQTSNGGGRYDAFLAKFTSSGTLSMGSYYGGKGSDSGLAICNDGSGNVYIAGSTQSSTLIATSGAYQTSFAGNYDAFLAEFRFFDKQNDAGIVPAKNFSIAACGSQYVKVKLKDYGTSKLTSDSIYWKVNGKAQTPIKWTGSLKTDSAASITLGPYNFSSGHYAVVAWGVQPNGVKDSIPENDTAKINFNVNTPAAAIISNTAICSGNAISIGASAVTGSSYSWSSSVSGFSSTSSNPTVSPTSTASYTLTETDSNSCVKSDSVTIKVNPLPAATVILSTAICSGSATYIGAKAVKGSSYSWSGSVSGFSSTSSNPSVSPTSVSSYTLIQTDSNGCRKSNSVTLTILKLPAAFVIPDTTICPGNVVSVGTAAVKGSSYSWSSWLPGFSSTSSNPSVSPTTTTTYYDTETDSNGCARKSNGVTINISALPAAKVISDTTICSGPTISIGGAAAWGSSYSWSGSTSGFSSTSSNPSITPNATAKYKLTETNYYGCVKSDSVTVSVSPLPAAFVIADTAICLGNALSIGASAVTGSSYSWTSSSPGFTSTSSNPSISPSFTSSYTLTETNAAGCVKSNSVTITVNTSPDATVISDTTICSGISISIGAVTVTGSSYSWSSSATGFSSTSSNPSVSPTTTSSYTLTESKTSGCFKTNSVTITVNANPSATVISNTAICSGNSISIGSSTVSGDSYAWLSNPSGFASSVSNPSVSPSSSATYKLTETKTNTGCSKTDSVTINLNPTPVAAFSYTNVCSGDSSVFSNKSTLATSFQWSFGDSTTSVLVNPKHLYASIGSYNVLLKATNSYGCTDSFSKKINISNCVWPGDANGDKVVDMNDFLAIGIAYGTVGHPRPSASIKWIGQPSPDWDSSFEGGINYNNADCNGDSVIDANDTIAISANYSDFHSKSGGINQGNPTDPGFKVKYLKDTFYAGDTLVAEVMLGNTMKPVINLYGLAFSIAFDQALFEADKAYMEINPSFLGTNGTDLIAMNKNSVSAGNMDIGICRINHQNASGNGVIATLYLPVKPILPQKSLKASLALSNNYQISFNEKNVPLYLSSDSVVLEQHNSGINNTNIANPFSLNIYPNPFTSKTSINFNLPQSSHVKISIMDMKGNVLYIPTDKTLNSGPNQVEIDATKAGLSAGTYFVNIEINDQVISKKIIEVR